MSGNFVHKTTQNVFRSALQHFFIVSQVSARDVLLTGRWAAQGRLRSIQSRHKEIFILGGRYQPAECLLETGFPIAAYRQLRTVEKAIFRGFCAILASYIGHWLRENDELIRTILSLPTRVRGVFGLTSVNQFICIIQTVIGDQQCR